MTDTATLPTAPTVNPVTRDDVLAALRAGWADFRAQPSYGIFFGAIFTLIGLLIFYMLTERDSVLWILPFIGAFPLIGPFAAVGLYEVSRRMEAGEPLTRGAILGAVFRERRRELPYMAVVVAFFLLAWLILARIILAVSFGARSFTNVFNSPEILLTGDGITMLIIGTAVGGVLAFLLFAITAVSIPLLLDKEIDIVTAMVTSYKAVTENLEPMLFWGAIVVGLTVLAMVPYFLGMIVVFPVLGHATWHIYRKTLSTEAVPEPVEPPAEEG